jgi:hypothetical protein
MTQTAPTVRLTQILRQGPRFFALHPVGIRVSLGVQLLDVLDVTDFALPHPGYDPAVYGVEIEATLDNLDEFGFARSHRVVAANTSAGGDRWVPIDDYRSAPALQVAIEIRAANTAGEQLRQLDDGEAVLSG